MNNKPLSIKFLACIFGVAMLTSPISIAFANDACHAACALDEKNCIKNCDITDDECLTACAEAKSACIEACDKDD